MPKYFRIKQAVLERIASGAWTPGAMIPSEVELCREFRRQPNDRSQGRQ